MSKSSTLNTLSTILGLIAGGSSLLGRAGAINRNLVSTIGGLATALLGYLVQQPTAGEQPQAPQPQPEK
ncbi:MULTISPECIES: hypothetical protein [unclassified Nostoc]|uniref:hypothetical protein n=1 Tax=unclassified Nostoc TaxID=2593658 RepID=UPI002AD1F997|nr:hypothetical protein [Nostoc sp. DedQUE03]MDZ7974021.1 hypothetical protein [Nostoc sp. DedQUE03]MDZ8048522.1 hypothetical protein [Nostoc sp. DedQUE02]